MVAETGNSHWQLCGKGSAGTQHRKHKGQAAVLCETSLLHNKPRPWGHARKILIQSRGNVSRPKHLHWSPHARLPTLPHRKLKLQNKSSCGAYLKHRQIPLDLFSCLLRPFLYDRQWTEAWMWRVLDDTHCFITYCSADTHSSRPPPWQQDILVCPSNSGLAMWFHLANGIITQAEMVWLYLHDVMILHEKNIT